MHRVEKIKESTATRILVLKNEVTGTRDECFDDSALVSDQNFDFMQVNQSYPCKIKLFGKQVSAKEARVVTCRVLNENSRIGNTDFVEVSVGEDVYYVLKSQVMNRSEKSSFIFKVSRKDLIQVNQTIHKDLY
ncbi:MAG: hypothetical protein LBV19_02065 [Streptococcaceae bacterium]|jgi:hypothetical protein|nr:hypothetical protein [Streptococcaceae bacterium]